MSEILQQKQSAQPKFSFKKELQKLEDDSSKNNWQHGIRFYYWNTNQN